ncbi:MAG TPA: hypothetical protein VK909_02500 [Anaerolineales bacterium]|nr:hypothetical protein [Anaerolineales bacterium]
MENSALPLVPDGEKKTSRFGWLAAILIALLILVPASVYAWRYFYNPCEVDAVKDASAFLVIQLKSYDHLYQVASTASQTSYEPPVLVMQQVQVDTQEIEVPACMRTAKNELISYMNTVIRAFRAWGAGEKDATVTDLLTQSDDHYDKFYDELDAIKKCAPWCFR